MRKLLLSLACITSMMLSSTVLVAPVYAVPFTDTATLEYLRTAPQTHWSTQALYQLGESLLSGDHLKTAVCDSAIACIGPILGITALGKDPRTFASENFVARLFSFYDGIQLGDVALLNDDMFGILALRAAGTASDDAALQTIEQYLVNHQNADGGFGWSIGASDVDDTAFAVMALIESGVAQSDAGIQKAVAYIAGSQNSDGGFPFDSKSPYDTSSNANSTALAMSMYYKMGLDPEVSLMQASGTPITYLSTLQTKEGWYEYQKGMGNFLPVDTTAQVAIALDGGSYPVRSITVPPPQVESEADTTENNPILGGGGGMYEFVQRQLQETTTAPGGVVFGEKHAIVGEQTADGGVIGQTAIFLEDGTLIKTVDDSTVYLIEKGRKRWIPDERILDFRFSVETIEVVAISVIDALSEGLIVGFPDGVYIRSDSDDEIYFLKDGKKYHVLTGEAWGDVSQHPDIHLVDVPSFIVDSYSLGGVIR